MKWGALVLVACTSKAPPPEKLGSDDIAQADRMPLPQPGDLAPLWAPLFVEDAKWKVDDVTCHAQVTVRIFDGWRTTIICEPDRFVGTFVGTRDALWLTDREVDDIRQLPESSRVPLQGWENVCVHRAAQVLCLRAFTGIVGGSTAGVTWGQVPRSW